MGHVELLKSDHRWCLQRLRGDQGYGWIQWSRGLLGDPGVIPDNAIHDKAAVPLLGYRQLVDENENIALEHDSGRHAFDFFHTSILA